MLDNNPLKSLLFPESQTAANAEVETQQTMYVRWPEVKEAATIFVNVLSSVHGAGIERPQTSANQTLASETVYAESASYIQVSGQAEQNSSVNFSLEEQARQAAEEARNL